MLFGCIESPYADVSKLLLNVVTVMVRLLVYSSRSRLLCKTSCYISLIIVTIICAFKEHQCQVAV